MQNPPLSRIYTFLSILLSLCFFEIQAQSPGNVSSNLELWLKADAGVTGSSPVTAWADQSGNGLDATASNNPTLITDGLNFNPTINFDGSSDRFVTASTALFSTNSSPVTVFVVFDTDNGTSQRFLLNQRYNNNCVTNFQLGYTAGGTPSRNYGLHIGCGHATTAPINTIQDNTFYLMSTLILNSGTAPSNINIFQNGGSETVANVSNGFTDAGSYDTEAVPLDIGVRDDTYGAGTSFDGYHDGDIAEIVIYTSTPSTTERQQIESYLAIKYGITIDQASATDYLASDGGTVWDGTANASYNTDITGIGRDDNSALDQQKSSSINSNAILTIANGDITTPSSFSADDSWLIWGSDNGATTFGSGNINNADGSTSNRMTRVWKVDETGTVGNVEIIFDNSLATGTVSIVIDPSDNTFANNAGRRVIEMTDNGSEYEVTVDFEDGEFFSFVNASAATLTTKPVLINEVIPTPQQDWSVGGFYNAAPGGSAGSDDEWVELYIADVGVDLTGWTIELLDGTDVTGDLTSSGAFQVSNYLSTAGGNFTGSAAGDYLILGNVAGAGAINATGTVTINLKNGSGLIIDQVVISASTGTGFNGSSSGTTDESISRIPSGSDTNVNSADYSKTRATLGTTNSPTGTVKINEVVTDPQTDWSTNGFDGTDGASTVSEVDEYIELYIDSDGINLTGWNLIITGFSGDLTSSGAFDVSNYVGTGSFIDTDAGDYLVLGNPDGSNSMGDSDLIILQDASGTEIDRVQLGGGGGQAPSGTSSSTSDEAIVRYTNASDTDADDNDFIQTVASLGYSNSLTGTVLINEVVTDPQQDWSTNNFNGTTAGGTVDTEDEWVELYIGTANINLTNWTIELTDGSDVTGDLTATGAFDVVNYVTSGSGSFLKTEVGDYLVLGNVDGSGDMSDDILITLRDATGTLVDEVELGDDPASDGAGDGAPDGSADGGDATGTSDEAISRIANATDTDNDVNDFSEAEGTPGVSNALVALPGPGNGLNLDGTDDYVDLGDLALTSGTVSLWLNADDVSDDRRIFAQISGATTQAGSLGIDPVNTDDFGIFVWDGSSWLQLVDVGSDWSGSWHHLTIVYSGGSATAYWDGVQQMTQTTNFDFNGVNFGLGVRFLDTHGDEFDGLIDELRIWNDTRTHEEILENMHASLDGSEANLTAYYNFDQSSGTSLPDIAGSNDGTLTNMAGSEWTAAGWNTYSQNAAILQSGGSDTSTGASGELTLADVAFLQDDNDILLAGHENSDFSEVTTDLPSSTLVTARYDRNWHITKNDASGTSNGNVTINFDLGGTPNSDYSYYLLERTGTSGDFAIVPVDGINTAGNSVIFNVNTSQLDDGSYYTLGRSDAGVGNALDFDGTDDYVDLDAQIVSPTAMTVEAWINASSFTSSGRLNRIMAIDYGSYTTDNPFALFVTDAGTIGYVFGTGDANNDIQNPMSFSPTLSTSTWYHIALTFDGSTKILYVNGIAEGSVSDAGTFTNTNSEQLLIGDFATATTNTGEWEGEIDEARIWDDVRTQDEIVSNMYANLVGDEANLVGYYRMNQGIGNNDNNLPDLSGDNNNGTLTNFDNLNAATASSNYVTSTRLTYTAPALIANGGSLTDASDELTLTSTQTAGDFLQDSGDQLIWGNDGGNFVETNTDLPSGTLVTSRIEKTWIINKNDEVGTANGNIVFAFDVSVTPNSDYTGYLLGRAGTSGDFSVIEIIDFEPNGTSFQFTVDAGQITNGNYYTLGWTVSSAGNAIDLDGSNDYVLVADASSLDISGNLTLEAWINLGTTPPSANEGIIAKYLTAGSQESYTLDINTSGNVVFDVSSDGSTNTTVTSGSTISTGEWTHLAAVYTPSTSLQIYINGVLDAENTTSIPASLHSGSADLWIGASSVINANNQIDASIDEVRVWSTARSKSQIQDNMFENLAGDETGLAAYYRFNQGDAGNTNTGIDMAPDRSGNTNPGALTNFALSGTSSNWIDSQAPIVDQNSSQALLGPGNALDFDGSNDHVIISDNATMESSSLLTVEAWLRPTTVASDQAAVSRYYSGGDASNVFLIDITSSAVLRFFINESGNNLVSATSIIAANEWTHVAGVADGSNVHIYVNGILKASTAYDGTITSNSTRDLVIGRFRTEDTFGPFVGQIDEVRIWNTARTATEIQDNMYVELTGGETGLVAYFQFDELAGSGTVPDESANGNTGTLTSMDAANDWVDASAREPFKSLSASNWNSTSTWKTATVPNSTSADLNITHDINLDANVTVDDMNINTGATLTLNASQTLTIQGDLINNGTIQGSGIISFEGAGAQCLTTGTYSNITLDNTADEINLEGNTTITGTLTLTNGNLVLGEYDLIISSGGAISGGGSSSYVQTINQNSSGGALQMEVANGAGNVTFPIGTSSYTPFSMINLGTTGDFAIRVFDDTYINGTSGAVITTAEEVDKTWDVTALGSGYNTTITIQWNSGDEVGTFDRTDMFISRNGADGIWRKLLAGINASGSDPYTASVSGVNSFSQIGGGSGSSSLPVQLLSFKGYNSDKDIILEWTTASELENEKFEIERSTDAYNFNKIGTEDGRGTTNEQSDYRHVDERPNNGSNYYRLKQVDFDGSYEYSEIVKVDHFSLADRPIVYPNPFSDNLTLQFPEKISGSVFIELYTLAGDQIANTSVQNPAKTIYLQNMMDLPAGIYFLHLKQNSSVSVLKLIKE